MILDGKLVIEDLDKLKITSIKHDGAVIHFSYNGEHYTFLNGGTDCTLVMTLYEGRHKCHLKHISSKYGMALDLIQYKHNKIALSSISKEQFVKVLQKHGFVDYQEKKARVYYVRRLYKKKLGCTNPRNIRQTWQIAHDFSRLMECWFGS